LDDIPEESGDEWDNFHIRVTSQEHQQRTHHHNHYHHFNNQDIHSQHATVVTTTTTTTTCVVSVERLRSQLRKAKSESNVSEKPRAASLYDEMMSGSWDSGKVLERSASVSEVR
jgi:hypothetical protein